MASVVLGGTFHEIHAGHGKLFTQAAKFKKITIGLTSDAYAKKMKIYPCAPYQKRKEKLEKHILRLKIHGKTAIEKINDKFGPSISDKSLSAIIVSEETEKAARQINSIRKKRKLPPLKVVSVPMAYANDHIRISSSRVSAGKIDADGRRVSPLILSLGTKNPVKLDGVRAAAKRAFPKIKTRVIGFKISGHAPEQPIGYAQTWEGARKRARMAYGKAGKNIDYGVGLESGLIKFGKHYYDIQFCCLYDGYAETGGCSMGFSLPEKITKKIMLENSSLGDVVSSLSGIKNIGTKGGALHYLSNGLLHRKEMVQQAFLCALVPRLGCRKM